ncbi:hypothetical protein [Bdellovibrio reynosensis]|uniref:Uncharacterized protein n=1 Tax=Bdellovibrio reynosensis TaxID=2835041 RepID=A0ABY4CAG8_9BACT|nr:hypothetical protein [Bdellovibrio reynosensis]UOF01905.1 hypothetical protein MNR06_02920 [Bdellovibrio reynosensis]
MRSFDKKGTIAWMLKKACKYIFLFFLLFNVAYLSLDLGCIGELTASSSQVDADSHCDETSDHTSNEAQHDCCFSHCTHVHSYFFPNIDSNNSPVEIKKEYLSKYSFHYTSLGQDRLYQPPRV